jgi:hypothetical protein
LPKPSTCPNRQIPQPPKPVKHISFRLIFHPH